jgi:hypothetical protein
MHLTQARVLLTLMIKLKYNFGTHLWKQKAKETNTPLKNKFLNKKDGKIDKDTMVTEMLIIEEQMYSQSNDIIQKYSTNLI